MIRSTLPLNPIALLALSCSAAACAQNPPVIELPQNSANAIAPPDAATEAKSRLLKAVSDAVIGIDSTGERTSEAIANYTVTLTLAEIQDSSALSVLCLNAGEPLRSLTQSVADGLDFQGQVLHPSCSGAGHDSDPFNIHFDLHREGGHTGLFQESPLLLSPQPFAIRDDDAEPPEREDRAVEMPSRDVPAAPPPAEPVPLNSRHTQTSHAVMTLPEGWTPQDLPKPVHADSPFATFDLTFSFSEGKLVSDQELVIKKEKVDPVDSSAFQKWVESSQVEGGAQTIELASTLYFPPDAFSGKTDDEKQAAKLIRDAFNDIESNHLDQAATALKQAEALDPGHEILHENKGRLAAAHGDYELALRNYQEELRAFPNVFIEMENIASAQMHLHRTDDAIATLQRWTAADHNSVFPVLQLMDLYHTIDRDDLACGAGDQAMLTLSEDGKRSVRFLLMYGHEQMLTGQVQNAKATFEKLLDSTTDIQFVNDAAYFLSEKGLSLDRGEEVVRSSLRQFDAETRNDMPHMFDMDEKQRTSLMLATWDTLGWILFNKDKLTEAEGYIRAAWHSHPDPAIGLHLGKLLLAKDKPVEALDALKLALASVPAKDQEKASKDPDVLAIRSAIERLEKAGHTSTLSDPAAALAKLSVLDAGPAGELHGESHYSVTLSATGIGAIPGPDSIPESESAIKIISAIKLPSDFFPEGSHATISREAKLNCNTVCSLTLLP